MKTVKPIVCLGTLGTMGCVSLWALGAWGLPLLAILAMVSVRLTVSGKLAGVTRRRASHFTFQTLLSNSASTSRVGSSTRRAGFTRIELLVAVAILGILIALLLPVVQAEREVARRAQCIDNAERSGPIEPSRGDPQRAKVEDRLPFLCGC